MEPEQEFDTDHGVAESQKPGARVPGRSKAQGYQQVLAGGNHPTTDNIMDDEYGDALAIMARQRMWVRGLSVVALALAVDVAALSIYAFRYTGSSGEGSSSNGNPTTSSSSEMFDVPKWVPLPPSEQRLTKLVFGSCASQFMPQPYWDTVLSFEPDLVILGGDNVYGDCQEETCHNLQLAYYNWTKHASFQGASQSVPIVATLDDHDYGTGDAWSDNPYKHLGKLFFLDFFPHLITEVPKDEDDGVYQQYTWGPPGQRVQVILMDTRYARSKFQANSDDPDAVEGPSQAPYKPSNAEEQQMLSQRQWTWLEAEISKPDIQIRLLISSIQVLNDGTGFECWRMLPQERQRLYDLMTLHCNSPIYIFSGDRHMGGFYEHEHTYGNDGNETENAAHDETSRAQFSFVEVTASSWTHTVPYGAFDNCTDASSCDEADPRRIGDFVRENHFSSIEIDWEVGNVTLGLRRAETVPGSQYSKKYHKSQVSAGQVLQSRTYSFLS